MHIKADTLDDALRRVFTKLVASPSRTRSTKGSARELPPTLITIRNPVARFSRTEGRSVLFSCLGETLWYLSGSGQLNVIEYYIPNYRKFSGLSARAKVTRSAYGPRVFGGGPDSRFERVVALLKRKPDTRQAVIQIFEDDDLKPGRPEVPCTCTLQFLPRSGKLNMAVSMRSNDAYRGMPHDVFAFTFIQELVARSLGHEMGSYSHFVGSLHLYDRDQQGARRYLTEGWQDGVGMAPMPPGDPWKSLAWLQDVERSTRLGERRELEVGDTDPYWVDLARLLRVKAHLDDGDLRAVAIEKRRMSDPAYAAFVRRKEVRLGAKRPMPQPGLPGLDEPGRPEAS